MSRCRGADTSSVVTLWEVKGKTLTPNISETGYNFANRFSPKVGARRVYKTPLPVGDSGSPFWGQVPPTRKSRFDHVIFFLPSGFFLKVFMARGYGDLGMLRFRTKF